MHHVIFLRAINVGGRRIRMADLRAAFDDAGYEGVGTYIASGNLLIEADATPDRAAIEAVIHASFGFHAEAFIRDEHQIRSVIERDPWKDPNALVEVSFLEDVPDAGASRELEATVSTPEGLVVSEAEVFFLREGKGIPPVHQESTTQRMLGMSTTRRGLATVRQIEERFLRG